MDSTGKQKMSAVEDFDPSMDWVKEPSADILRVYIPGFRKEQLKVQVTSSKHLRISGERQDSNNRRIRLQKEIPIASNYDPNAISAKFTNGILLITHPKIIAPAPEPQGKLQPPKEAAKPPRPPQPAVEPRKPQELQARPPAEAPKPQQPASETQKPQEKERQPAGEAPKSQEKPPQLAANAPKVQEPTTAPAQPPPKPKEEKKKEKQENESYNTNSGRSFSEQLAASGSKFKKVLCDAVMEMKKKDPRDLINRVMVILIVIVAIYALKLAVRQFDRKSHEN